MKKGSTDFFLGKRVYEDTEIVVVDNPTSAL
jgi:hypothetical protein